MQTTMNNVASDVQAAYPQCINELKSNNRTQAMLWLIIAVVLFIIYNQQPEKDTTLGLVQISLVALCVVLAVYKFFSTSSKLIYSPTGSAVKKQSYSFNISLQADLLHCLKEGNTARIKAFKNDDAGGLLVEFLESEDHLFTAARLFKYEPHGYEDKTGWIIMKS